ncbi:rhodanese-like domain-containing protein [Sorangium sp. So ce590]|uniref:sulfurtransferase n=1 Tax=Sorangium sp. So ce590 TaxID=3133317 RepID=UPI003F5EE801
MTRAEALETSASAPQPGASLLRSPAWVAAHLDDPSVVVIHADRDRRTYDREHIPGARFLSVDALAVDRDVPNELPPLADVKAAFERAGVVDGSQVVLYGGMDGLAPARAFFALDVIGHGHRAALLDGSLGAWRAEGHPISSEAAEPRPGTLTSKPEPERVVDADWVAAHLDDPGVVLVDARPPDESGADASTCPSSAGRRGGRGTPEATAEGRRSSRLMERPLNRAVLLASGVPARDRADVEQQVLIGAWDSVRCGLYSPDPREDPSGALKLGPGIRPAGLVPAVELRLCEDVSVSS